MTHQFFFLQQLKHVQVYFTCSLPSSSLRKRSTEIVQLMIIVCIIFLRSHSPSHFMFHSFSPYSSSDRIHSNLLPFHHFVLCLNHPLIPEQSIQKWGVSGFMIFDICSRQYSICSCWFPFRIEFNIVAELFSSIPTCTVDIRGRYCLTHFDFGGKERKSAANELFESRIFSSNRYVEDSILNKRWFDMNTEWITTLNSWIYFLPIPFLSKLTRAFSCLFITVQVPFTTAKKWAVGNDIQTWRIVC